MDWIKVEHTLHEKPEVFGIARRVGQDRTKVVGLLIRVWCWADRVTATGNDLAITASDIDEIAGLPGLAEAMRAEGWLSGRDGSLQLPNYQRHNGNSAKARALESEAKRLRRLSDNPSDETSDTCPTKPATNVGPDERRREETRGESQSSPDEWKTIGKSARNGRSSQSSPSSKDFQDGEDADTPKADLTGLDWGSVVGLAESLARKIPPKTENDRRMWLRFAVMAERWFSEAWLMDGVDCVLNAKEHKRHRQAHLVGVLRSSLAESDPAMTKERFVASLRSIEIPTEVWKSQAVEVRQ